MNAQPVAIVTGASAGIGSVIARTLARAGYRVYGTSRSPQPVANTPFNFIELDVTDDDSVRRCVEYVGRSAGRIDVLVNNVGSLVFGSAEETPLSETIRELELNFLGAVRMTQAVLPLMREHKSGRIINMSSLAGRVGLPMNSASSAGKFALEGYSESLRTELLTYGVYVSLISLSATRSDGQSRSMRPTSQTMHLYNPQRERALERMRRDIAAASVIKQQVADTVLHILRQKRPTLRYNVGMPSRVIPLLKFILPYTVFERIVRARVEA